VGGANVVVRLYPLCFVLLHDSAEQFVVRKDSVYMHPISGEPHTYQDRPGPTATYGVLQHLSLLHLPISTGLDTQNIVRYPSHRCPACGLRCALCAMPE
jgi:hypothetical protein